MGGWDQVRARLKGDPDGNPMLIVFDTCIDTIRTLPMMQHDPDRLEDLQTDSEDHCVDELRYACMSRPFIRGLPPAPKKFEIRLSTFNEPIAAHEQGRRNGEGRI